MTLRNRLMVAYASFVLVSGTRRRSLSYYIYVRTKKGVTNLINPTCLMGQVRPISQTSYESKFLVVRSIYDLSTSCNVNKLQKIDFDIDESCNVVVIS